MRVKKAVLVLTCSFTLFVLVLMGCAPREAGTDGNAQGQQSASYAPGSMRAAHTPDQLGETDDFSKKLCLSCHPRDAINAVNEDLLGQVGMNPHAAHTAAPECIDCHSVEDAPSMYCNTCHTWEVPENWTSPERTGAGPVPK
jgi:hypothetical protein